MIIKETVLSLNINSRLLTS